MGVELDNGTDEEQRKRAELTRGFKVTPYISKAQMVFWPKKVHKSQQQNLALKVFETCKSSESYNKITYLFMKCDIMIFVCVYLGFKRWLNMIGRLEILF